MGRNKQNEKAKKDGKHRRETKEEKKERLKNAQEAREAFTKAIPYALGAAVLLMIVFGLYVQSIPPREVLQKAAAQHAFKVGSDGLPQFMSEATDQNEAGAKATESENVVPTLHDESPHVEETLEL